MESEVRVKRAGVKIQLLPGLRILNSRFYGLSFVSGIIPSPKLITGDLFGVNSWFDRQNKRHIELDGFSDVCEFLQEFLRFLQEINHLVLDMQLKN